MPLGNSRKDDIVLKNFQLFEFVTENNESELKEIDLAPKGWIFSKEEDDNIYTKFMKPPYNAERRRYLNQLISRQSPAPEDWPSYAIILRGHASTYKEALYKLNHILTHHKYCYTTANELEAEEKAEEISKVVRSKKFHISEDTMLAMKVPSLDEPINSNNLESTRTNKNSIISNLESELQERERFPLEDITSAKKHIEDPISKEQEFKKNGKSANANRNCIQKKIDSFFSSSKNIINGSSGIQQKRKSSKPGTSFINSTDDDYDREDLQTPKKFRLLKKRKEPAKTSTLPSLSFHYEKMDVNENTLQNQHFQKQQELKSNKKSLRQQINIGSFKSLNTLQSSVCQQNQFSTTTNEVIEVDLTTKLQIDTMLNMLTKLEISVNELKKEVKKQSGKISYLSQQMNCTVPQVYDFAQEHNIHVPIKEMEDFMNFDQKLKEDSFRRGFISALPINYDPAMNARKSITSILKKYLSRNVAIQFVTVKHTENKKIFKDTEMYSCILAAMKVSHKDEKSLGPLTEKTFLSELSSILPNAKDWDGGRSLRANETKKVETQRCSENLI